MAKAILYLGLPDLRRRISREGSEAQAAARRAVSGAHKRKALRAAIRSYDTIHILPPASESHDLAAGEGGDGRHVRAHWRRGHFRRQRHGPKLALSKVVWLRPQLVNAAALAGGSPPTPANYRAGL